MKRKLYLIFIIIEIILLGVILWSEGHQPYAVSGKLMYLSVVLCLPLIVMGLYTGWKQRFSGMLLFLLPLGFALTLAADYFLTLTDTHWNLGIFLFCMVQLVYGIYLSYSKKGILLRIILAAAFVVLFAMIEMVSVMSVLGALDLALLIGNTVEGFDRYRETQDRKLLLLAIGLLLFAGCDINLAARIALEAMRNYGPLHQVVNGLIWIFYLPSQICICTSFYLKRSGLN